MNIRPVDQSERIALLERWESKQAQNRRRAACIAWASVGLAAIVLVALIRVGDRELAGIREQVNSETENLKTVTAAKEKAERELKVVEQQRQISLSMLGNVNVAQRRAAVDQAISQNPQAANILPRVYLQIVDEGDREYAKQLGASLQAIGCVVLGVELRSDAAKFLKTTEVRYYKKTDEEWAYKIRDVLKEAGDDPSVRAVYLGLENSTKVRPKHYEVWFASKNVRSNRKLEPAASRATFQ